MPLCIEKWGANNEREEGTVPPPLPSVRSLRRIPPEPLQIVVTPCFFVENMDDEIMVVKQNPARPWIPLAVVQPDLHFLETLVDVVSNGPHVPVRIRTADQKMICNTGDPLEVQDDGIEGLDLPGCTCCQIDQSLGIYSCHPPSRLPRTPSVPAPVRLW